MIDRTILWTLINEYAATCGGNPSENVCGNTLRQAAVARIEKAIDRAERRDIVERDRAETGPMKFGDDWTGVFIRGDNALMMMLPAVEWAIAADQHLDFGVTFGLNSLRAVLLSAAKQVAQPGDGPVIQHMRPFRACLGRGT